MYCGKREKTVSTPSISVEVFLDKTCTGFKSDYSTIRDSRIAYLPISSASNFHCRIPVKTFSISPALFYPILLIQCPWFSRGFCDQLFLALYRKGSALGFQTSKILAKQKWQVIMWRLKYQKIKFGRRSNKRSLLWQHRKGGKKRGCNRWRKENYTKYSEYSIHIKHLYDLQYYTWAIYK